MGASSILYLNIINCLIVINILIPLKKANYSTFQYYHVYFASLYFFIHVLKEKRQNIIIKLY